MNGRWYFCRYLQGFDFMSSEGNGKKFYNIGLSYKKADVQTRGAFSISKTNQQLLLEEAKSKGFDGIFVLSTCNRTEITGFANHPFELIQLLCKYSNGSVDDFVKVSSVSKGNEAINHLFKIGTGLDSQILGDYEIVSQLKQSFQLAKTVGVTNAFIERLMNSVLQASKEVKNNTKISSGTTSVSYAAVQYIQEHFDNYLDQNIVVFGLGEIGQHTCKNLIEYAGIQHLNLINRTFLKAREFSDLYQNINLHAYDELETQIANADILIVATASDKPTVGVSHLLNAKKPKLVIDLSMPENVDIAVKSIDGITLINVDELSDITDKTLESRKLEVPKAQAIIEVHKSEFMEWLDHRKLTPVITALKDSLKVIQADEIDFHRKKIKDFNEDHAEVITSRLIQKITTQFVKHLKSDDTSINQSIEVMQKVFNLTEITTHESKN